MLIVTEQTETATIQMYSSVITSIQSLLMKLHSSLLCPTVIAICISIHLLCIICLMTYMNRYRIYETVFFMLFVTVFVCQ